MPSLVRITGETRNQNRRLAIPNHLPLNLCPVVHGDHLLHLDNRAARTLYQSPNASFSRVRVLITAHHCCGYSSRGDRQSDLHIQLGSRSSA